MKTKSGIIENIYAFNDAISKAASSKKTLRQYITDAERINEDPRVKGFLDMQNEQLYKARLQEVELKDSLGQEGLFPYNRLTALDLNIRRPMFKTYAPKHVPFLYGGGAIEVDKGFFRNYATVQGRLASGQNNKVNLVKSNTESLEAPILPITLGLWVGVIDNMKAEQIGYDVIGAEAEAVRYSYQVELDKFAFVGHRGIDGGTNDTSGMPRGLLNLTSDLAPVVDLESSNDVTTKDIRFMNTLELHTVYVGEYLNFAMQVGYDEEFLANKYLLPTDVLAALTKPAHITDAGTVYKSHLEYLQAQLDVVRKTINGPEVAWEALPYLNEYSASTFNFDPLLNEDGTNNTGRNILYRQDPYAFRLRLALDLTPGALLFDPGSNGWRRNYIAFIGTPLPFYNTFRYIDNGVTIVSDEEFELVLPASTTHGTLTTNIPVADLENVAKGTLVRITLVADAEKELKTFTVNGVNKKAAIGSDGTYVFRIYADTVIAATFGA